MSVIYPLFKRFKRGGFHLWFVDSISGKHHLLGWFDSNGKLTKAQYSFTSRKVKINGPDWKHLQKMGDSYNEKR